MFLYVVLCCFSFSALELHLLSLNRRAARPQTAGKKSTRAELTLDHDATFIETETSGALYNYKGKRSYEALNVYCPEYDLVVATEFRDGNVNPGHGQLAQL